MVQETRTETAPHGEVQKTRYQSSTDADVQRCVVCGSKTYGPELCSDPHPMLSRPQSAEDAKTQVDEGTERVGFEDVLSRHGDPHAVEEVVAPSAPAASEPDPRQPGPDPHGPEPDQEPR